MFVVLCSIKKRSYLELVASSPDGNRVFQPWANHSSSLKNLKIGLDAPYGSGKVGATEGIQFNGMLSAWVEYEGFVLRAAVLAEFSADSGVEDHSDMVDQDKEEVKDSTGRRLLEEPQEEAEALWETPVGLEDYDGPLDSDKPEGASFQMLAKEDFNPDDKAYAGYDKSAYWAEKIGHGNAKCLDRSTSLIWACSCTLNSKGKGACRKSNGDPNSCQSCTPIGCAPPLQRASSKCFGSQSSGCSPRAECREPCVVKGDCISISVSSLVVPLTLFALCRLCLRVVILGCGAVQVR